MSVEFTGRVVGLQQSHGGVPKRPVDSATVHARGMDGDRQRKRLIHGGPKRALCLYSQERIEALAAEGHPIAPGGSPKQFIQGGAGCTCASCGRGQCVSVIPCDCTRSNGNGICDRCSVYE